MSPAADSAIESLAQSRVAASRLRFLQFLVLALAGFLTTDNALFAVAGLSLLCGGAALDLAAARALVASTPQQRKQRRYQFIAASAFTAALLAGFCLLMSATGGQAGRLVAFTATTGNVLALMLYMFQDRLFVIACALPNAVVFACLPFFEGASAAPREWGLLALAIVLVDFWHYLARGVAHNRRVFASIVQARNDAIEQRSEAEARKLEAEQANRAKAVLLSNVSHELRTPLNAIIGYSEMLQEVTNEPPAELAKIRSAGLRLLHIVKDLMRVAELDSGRAAINLVEVEAGPLMAELAERFRHRAALHGNEIVVEPSGEWLMLRTDPDRLRECLAELLENAIRHTRNGVVRLRAHPIQAHIAFVVEDTGSGMDEATLDSLFDVYAHPESSTSTRAEGSGLGLAIVYRAVQLLGGSISANSVPGEGARFMLALPLAPQARDLAASL